MAARLVAGDPDRRIGTAIMLKVMPGDRFTISADAYHEGDLPNDGSTGMEDMLESLLNTLLGGSTYAGATVADLPSNVATVTTALTTPGLADQIADLQLVNHDPAAPKAHLNVLFFDESLKLVPEYSAVGQVPASLTSWINVVPNTSQTSTLCCATPGAGYIVVYVDNQTIGKDVWFDNISIEHYTSNVIEENHYYPYGLTLTTSAAGVKEQPYRYQGIELERNFGLEMYETQNRGLDPQIGRFTQIDMLAENSNFQSPYASMDNNPANNTDPDGLYSRFGAWWRNIAWDGTGTFKDSKTGEWGVQYVQIDPDGDPHIYFQTKGSRAMSQSDAIELLKERHRNIQEGLEMGTIRFDEDNKPVRKIDGKSVFEAPSGQTRSKMLLNALEPVTFMASPVAVVSSAAKGVLKPLGLGSTGRTAARNLTEQLAMKEALSNPAAGQIIQRMKPLTDPRWSGWRKMQYEHIGLDGSKTIIHYNGQWSNGVLKAVDDFKFK
jgi:RHS repeat-associated protein